MFPQTMFFPPVDPNCPCPPVVIGGALVLDNSVTHNLTNATQNNFTFTDIDQTNRLLLTTQGDLDVVMTGMAAQVDGFTIFVWNVDQTPNTITLSHADALSLAANRFYLPGAVDLVLGQYDGVLLTYTQSLNGGVGGWLAQV